MASGTVCWDHQVHPTLRLTFAVLGVKGHDASLEPGRQDGERPSQDYFDAGPRMLRAITTRWIWLVPSYIWVIFASRRNRSTGKSLV